ncbi:MAG: nuclear transport factor 2 family protein [Elusimicrobia bacterium]|nr:nuclear transport factor 2 family protein [Elusimicrobiota bacterium]
MSAKALETIVRKMFKMLDSRNFSAFLELFTSDAQITHADGLRTTPQEFIQEIQKIQEWPKRSRTLSQFRFSKNPAHAWVSYQNKVTFEPNPGQPLTFQFSETAFLRRVETSWHFFRIHYEKE